MAAKRRVFWDLCLFGVLKIYSRVICKQLIPKQKPCNPILCRSCFRIHRDVPRCATLSEQSLQKSPHSSNSLEDAEAYANGLLDASLKDESVLAI
jgi:hypothetical protein